MGGQKDIERLVRVDCDHVTNAGKASGEGWKWLSAQSPTQIIFENLTEKYVCRKAHNYKSRKKKRFLCLKTDIGEMTVMGEMSTDKTTEDHVYGNSYQIG